MADRFSEGMEQHARQLHAAQVAATITLGVDNDPSRITLGVYDDPSRLHHDRTDERMLGVDRTGEHSPTGPPDVQEHERRTGDLD